VALYENEYFDLDLVERAFYGDIGAQGLLNSKKQIILEVGKRIGIYFDLEFTEESYLEAVEVSIPIIKECVAMIEFYDKEKRKKQNTGKVVEVQGLYGEQAEGAKEATAPVDFFNFDRIDDIDRAIQIMMAIRYMINFYGFSRAWKYEKKDQ